MILKKITSHITPVFVFLNICIILFDELLLYDQCTNTIDLVFHKDVFRKVKMRDHLHLLLLCLLLSLYLCLDVVCSFSPLKVCIRIYYCHLRYRVANTGPKGGLSNSKERTASCSNKVTWERGWRGRFQRCLRELVR